MSRKELEIAKELVSIAETFATAGRAANKDAYLAAGSIRRKHKDKFSKHANLAALDAMLAKAEEARTMLYDLGKKIDEVIPEGDLRAKYRERIFGLINASKSYTIKGLIDELSTDFLSEWNANPQLSMKDQNLPPSK